MRIPDVTLPSIASGHLLDHFRFLWALFDIGTFWWDGSGDVLMSRRSCAMFRIPIAHNDRMRYVKFSDWAEACFDQSEADKGIRAAARALETGEPFAEIIRFGRPGDDWHILSLGATVPANGSKMLVGLNIPIGAHMAVHPDIAVLARTRISDEELEQLGASVRSQIDRVQALANGFED